LQSLRADLILLDTAGSEDYADVEAITTRTIHAAVDSLARAPATKSLEFKRICEVGCSDMIDKQNSLMTGQARSAWPAILNRRLPGRGEGSVPVNGDVSRFADETIATIDLPMRNRRRFRAGSSANVESSRFKKEVP